MRLFRLQTGWFFQSPDEQQAHTAAFHVTFHIEKKNKPCQQTSTSPREESSKTEERSHYVHQKAQYQSHFFLATQIYLHTPWSPHLIPTKPGLEQHNDAGERQDIPKTCSWSPITQALQRKSTTTSQKLVGCLLSVQAINLLIQNQCVIEVQNASKALRL